jgi:hypothetical protein
MASNPSGKQGPGWRGSKAGAPRKPAVEPGWRSGLDLPTGGRRKSRKLRLAIATGLFLTLVGVLAGLIWMIYRPRPAALVLVGAGYEENLTVPHNVYGWKGLGDLAAWCSGTGRPLSWLRGVTGAQGTRLLHDPKPLTEPAGWDIEAWKKSRDKALVIFVALHGGADRERGYLYLDDAKGGRLRLQEDVIDSLAPITKEQKKKVLLILDATQVNDHWPDGMVHNDFARRLDGLNARIKDQDNLLVLSASGPDQRSWASEEWQQTIFTHFVLEGLKGAADTDHSDNVSALELFEYVRDKAKAWARDNRAALQKPVLLPREEGPARAKQMFLVNLSGSYREEPADHAPGGDFREGLKVWDDSKAWERHDQFLAATPSPAVYAPHLWRLYEATLLRSEQLLRAGDADHARRLLQKLTDLEEQIGKAPRLDDLACRLRSLGLRALAGDRTEAVLKDARTTIENLWNSPREDQRKQRWEKTQAEAAKGPAAGALRGALAEALLNRVLREERATEEDFEKAYQILRLVYGAGNDRPVELHLLGLLGRDLRERGEYRQEKPPLEDLVLALRTCRLGEEIALSALPVPDPGRRPVYAYSELVYPWIKRTVQQADAERHNGENQLFGEGSASWHAARDAFLKAERGYKDAGERAAAVRQALAVYHEAASWLPWYAQYLARSAAGTTERLEQVEKLADDTERLANLLSNPDSPTAELRDSARPAWERLQKAQEAFESHGEELARKQAGERPSLWRELDAVLGVPGIKAETRRALLEKIRRTSQALNLGGAGKAPEPEQDPRAVQEEARRQARMALAVLGPSGIGDSFEKEHQRALEPADPWYTTLADVGDAIRAGWKRLGADLRQLGEAPPEGQSPDKAEADIVRAERLARKADGATAYPLYGLARLPDPLGEYHRLKLQDLFRELAERVQADHWWSEQDTAPYYAVTGRAYLKDAQAQALPRHETLQQQRDKLRAELNKRLDRAGIDIPPANEPLALTDEPRREVAFTLQVDPLVPAGKLTVWARSTDPLEMEPVAAARSLKDARGQSMPYPVYRRSNVLTAAKAQVALHVRYRGQRVDYTLPVVLAGEPDLTVYQHPPARTAKIAVRADDEVYKQLQWEQMRIAIVFDRSNSMGYAGIRKFDEATGAFQSVLSELEPGPRVSLWTFGHRQGKPDQRAEQLQAPTRWRGGPDQAREFMEKVRAVKSDPYAFSPIVHTMVQACEEDLDLGRPKPDKVGAKLLVVLTDGEDNLFEKEDAQYNPQHRSIEEYLKETFDDSDIQILMVTFKVPEKERASAQRQFEKLKLLRRRPARFSFADNVTALTRQLREMLEPRDLRCRVEHPGDDQPVDVSDDPDHELRVSREGENLIPTKAVLPRGYLLHMPLDVRQEVFLNPGDVLLLDVKGERGAWYLQRALFKDYREKVHASRRGLPAAQQGEWLASVQQNEILPGGSSLRMLVSAEKLASRSGRRIQLTQLRPEFTWFDLEAPGAAKKPRRLSWRNVGDVRAYPAPTWRLDVEDWPADALPRVRAWVRDVSPSRDPSLRARFVHNPGTPLESLFPKPVEEVGDIPVRGLSVTLERMPVQELPDRLPQEQPCLVVRAQYPPNSPILAELDRLAVGHEHRFYAELNQYTGVFWPVEKADVERADFALSLISLKGVMAAPPLVIDLKPEDERIKEPPPIKLPETAEGR